MNLIGSFMMISTASLLGWSTDGHSDPLRTHVVSDSLVVRVSSLVDQESDRIQLTRLMRSRGYAFAEIMAESGAYYAVYGKEVESDRDVLMVIERQRDSLAFVEHQPILFSPGPDVDVQWITVSPASGVMLKVTRDNSVEGPRITKLYRIVKRQLVKVYGDSLPTGCKPAEVRDLNGDGSLELISYVDNPSHQHCTNMCQFVMRQAFGMPVAWARISEWSDEQEQWVVSEQEFPSFYAELADLYDQLHAWVLDDEANKGLCGDVGWLRKGEVFAEWAALARRLASEGG